MQSMNVKHQILDNYLIWMCLCPNLGIAEKSERSKKVHNIRFAYLPTSHLTCTNLRTLWSYFISSHPKKLVVK